jgi:hypothetical protein
MAEVIVNLVPLQSHNLIIIIIIIIIIIMNGVTKTNLIKANIPAAAWRGCVNAIKTVGLSFEPPTSLTRVSRIDR